MRTALATLGLIVVGCYQPNYSSAPFLCQRSDRCPPGYRCFDGVCRSAAPQPDAQPDAQLPPDRTVAPPDRAPPVDRAVDAQPPADRGVDAPPACTPPGTTCDDGNSCTADDACSPAGLCTGIAAPDGTSCGALPADVCCAGQCTNLTRDEANCGGCGLPCAAGYTCGDAASPPKCSDSPADTSGRCRCDVGNSALCPQGQSCRSNTPADGWCTPNDPAECAPGQRVELVTNCPNYCVY